MSDDRHYFSSLTRWAATACILLAVSACSSAAPDLFSATQPARNAPTPKVAMIEKAGQPANRSQGTVRPATGKRQNPVVTPTKARTRPAMARSNENGSQWCKYIKHDAAAQSTVLLGPTISGAVNDDGRKSFGVGFDVLNIARAKLLKDAARAKCARYLANSSLNRMAVVAPTRLSRAGYMAKARVIRQRRRNLSAIKVLVNQELKTGNLDRSQATKLLLAVNQLIADGAKAASEAAKSQGLVAYDLKNVEAISRQLVKAERDLADINSNIRSADAVSVNLDGGWREGLQQNGFQVQKDSFYGAVKVSVNLGAFNPNRFKHERAAARARIKAYRTEPGGAVWKLYELRNAQIRAKAGMISSRASLRAARANAGRLKATLPVGDPVFLVQRYGAEIQIIRLDAELAGVNATIRQLDQNLAKLAVMGR